MGHDLCFLPATDLRRRMAAKEISPLDVTRAVLARAERLQPELNCFITICADQALAQARDAERRIMAGEPLRMLEGIPFTVKDIVNTRNVRTTFGAIPYKDNVPDHDAVAVARLRAAGAILIGKTTTPEFGTKCLTDSRCAGVRATPGAASGPAAARAAGRRWRWPAALRRSRSQPTAAARPAFQLRATAWSGSSRAMA